MKRWQINAIFLIIHIAVAIFTLGFGLVLTIPVHVTVMKLTKPPAIMLNRMGDFLWGKPPKARGISLNYTREQVRLSHGEPESRTMYRLPDHGYFNWYISDKRPSVSGDITLFQGEHPLPFGFLETDPVENYGREHPKLFSLCGTFGGGGYEVWTYGDSQVVFGCSPFCVHRVSQSGRRKASTINYYIDNCDDCRKINFVRAWANAGELKLTKPNINKPLNYGMDIYDVIRSQGNPTLICPTSWKEDEDCVITLSSPVDEGAQILYYFNPDDLKLQRERGFFFCSQEPSKIFIAPVAELSADIEFAKSNKILLPRYTGENVIGWDNQGHLRVAPPSKVTSAQSIFDDRSEKRVKDLKQIQELFELFKPAALSRLESIISTNHSERSLDNFLRETSKLSSYDKGLKFEKLCQEILEKMGYEVEHTGQRGDRGVDLKAINLDPINSMTLLVQCKHTESVSQDILAQLLGMVHAEKANKGLVMTTGLFTSDAKKFAVENDLIEINDKDTLDDLMKKHLTS